MTSKGEVGTLGNNGELWNERSNIKGELHIYDHYICFVSLFDPCGMNLDVQDLEETQASIP